MVAWATRIGHRNSDAGRDKHEFIRDHEGHPEYCLQAIGYPLSLIGAGRLMKKYRKLMLARPNLIRGCGPLPPERVSQPSGERGHQAVRSTGREGLFELVETVEVKEKKSGLPAFGLDRTQFSIEPDPVRQGGERVYGLSRRDIGLVSGQANNPAR
jgi:hypothetical protein